MSHVSNVVKFFGCFVVVFSIFCTNVYCQDYQSFESKLCGYKIEFPDDLIIEYGMIAGKDVDPSYPMVPSADGKGRAADEWMLIKENKDIDSVHVAITSLVTGVEFIKERRGKYNGLSAINRGEAKYPFGDKERGYEKKKKKDIDLEELLIIKTSQICNDFEHSDKKQKGNFRKLKIGDLDGVIFEGYHRGSDCHKQLGPMAAIRRPDGLFVYLIEARDIGIDTFYDIINRFQIIDSDDLISKLPDPSIDWTDEVIDWKSKQKLPKTAKGGK